MQRTVIGLVFLVLLGLLSACSSAQPAVQDPLLKQISRLNELQTETFVGKVASTDAYIAVVNLEGEVLVYACDGKPGNASVLSKWYVGTLKGNQLSATARDGSSLTGTLSGDTLTGSLGGFGGTQVLSFSASKSGKPAGLWLSLGNLEAFTEENPNVHMVGWIVLPDGTQRGAVKKPSETIPASALNTANGSNTSGEVASVLEHQLAQSTAQKKFASGKCANYTSMVSYYNEGKYRTVITSEVAGAASLAWLAFCYSQFGSMNDYL